MSLNILPLEGAWLIAMPDWVLVALIYWALAEPESASVGKAWLVGLLVDALTGQLLGQYALAYSVSIFLCIKQHKRIRQFPIIQQSLFVCLILFGAQFLIYWIESFSHQDMPVSFWLPVLTGGLAWPVVSFILRKVRHL